MMTNIILAVILLHLIGGFGWLIYKLSPRKGDEQIDDGDSNENNKTEEE